MTDTLARLASDNDLEDQVGLSPEGLTDRYLYSSDMVFRYAFGRWWGNTDLATTAIWVLLNPRPATPNSDTGPRWSVASPGPGPPGIRGW